MMQLTYIHIYVHINVYTNAISIYLYATEARKSRIPSPAPAPPPAPPSTACQEDDDEEKEDEAGAAGVALTLCSCTTSPEARACRNRSSMGPVLPLLPTIVPPCNSPHPKTRSQHTASFKYERRYIYIYICTLCDILTRTRGVVHADGVEEHEVLSVAVHRDVQVTTAIIAQLGRYTHAQTHHSM